MPIERHITVNQVDLAFWEWPGAQPTVIFAHANGFHGRVWDQTIGYLAGRHCIAVDLRGHGRSAKPAPPYRWRAFGEDLAALARALDLRGALAVGHSLGGHAVTYAAAIEPAAWGALLLIDPVILPDEAYEGPPMPEHFSARRRNRWGSPEQMILRFHDRLPFSRWQPQVLRDYCVYGLLPEPDGDGYVLACPPEVEASIYLANHESRINELLGTIAIPVHVLRAGTYRPVREWDMLASPTRPDLAALFRHGHDSVLDHHSHFIPMEDPELVARQVQEMISEWGAAHDCR